MTQGERVLEIRKTLDLTMDKFGEKLGVQKSAISKIEKGRVNLSDQMVKLICREYNVNYDYLTTGEGEMFDDLPQTVLYTRGIIQMLSGNLGHSHNTIHRCTDIVRHARQKQAFRAVGMLRRIVRFLHGLLQLLTSASCVMNVL